ncbi:MAG: CTB family bacteriocin [Hydrococcus sp. C42_A2020_068]|nr:CTB family bacteriocin [Hydrococcus sp. C42_A2020_068]
MTEPTNKINASVEMSEQELDAVAGGVFILGGGPQALFQKGSTDFAQNQLVAAQKVSSNRNGSEAQSLVVADAVKTDADQITEFINGAG